QPVAVVLAVTGLFAAGFAAGAGVFPCGHPRRNRLDCACRRWLTPPPRWQTAPGLIDGRIAPNSPGGSAMSTTRLMGNPAGMTTLMTMGHGSLERGALVRLLTEHDVELLVDVRRYPGSRRNPQTKPDALKESLTRAGIDYRWDERLGGPRRLASDSRDTWWGADQFRAYGGRCRTPGSAPRPRELPAAAPGCPPASLWARTARWWWDRR